MLIVWFLSIKSLPNLLFGVLCLPGDQSHPFAQPTINPLACCICCAVLLGRAVFPPWNEGPNFGSYMITHLEPDILVCKVKWALGSITANKTGGGDGIPAELFQILKDDAVKVLHSVCQQIWKTQQWPQDWKRSAFITVPKKGNARQCSDYHTIALISHASKVILKVLQARFQ